MKKKNLLKSSMYLFFFKYIDEISQKLFYPFHFRLETEDYSNLDDTLIDPDDIEIEENTNETTQDTESQQCSQAILNEKSDEVEKITYKKIKRAPRKTFKCDTCKSIFNSSMLLKVHRSQNPQCNLSEDKVKSEGTVACPDCSETFENESDYNIHTSIHKAFDTFICLHCRKNCGNRKGLKRHVKTHYTSKPFKCKRCQQQFSEVASLTRHYKKHLGIEKEKKYPCQMCDQQFYDNYTLDVHIRSKHTGDSYIVKLI